MRSIRIIPCLFAGLALAVLVAPRVAIAQPSADACIKFSGEVRYGALGYNHIVHVTNTCKVAADCQVSTDVAPQPIKTEVGPGAHVAVTTFLGSPARAFTPHVTCTMQNP